MFRLLPAAALAACASLLPALPATAQSALGFTGAELSLGTLSGDGGDLRRLDGALDVAITAHHGLQLDLGLADYGPHWFGSIAAHLYLQPGPAAKYGLFAAYADANDTEAATAEIGAEGMWQPAPGVVLEARAGLGRAQNTEIDYVFASLSGAFALSDRTALHAGARLLDIDEAAASVTALSLDLGLSHALPSAPVELYAGLSRLSLSGDVDAGETRLSLGLTAWLGTPRSARAPVGDRRFSPVRPLAELIARDMVFTPLR